MVVNISSAKNRRFLDLCSGREGASREFIKRGWDVFTVDIDPKFNPSLVADVNNLHIETPGEFAFVWASPPCPDFTKAALPASWKCNGGKHRIPDMKPLMNCIRIIRYLQPRWWAVENVQGAIPYFRILLGDPVKRVGSRILWGDFPIFDTSPKYGKWKLSPTKDRPAIRSEIPAGISKALCLACGGAA